MASSQSFAQALRQRLFSSKMAMFCSGYMVIIIIIAVFAPYLTPYTFYEQDLDLGATPPSPAHPFGTDTLGRDMWTRVLLGSRVSLAVCLVATSVAVTIGVLWGMTAGYIGGKIDSAMMRFVDILYAIPFVLFIVLLTLVFGRHLWLMFVAIGCVEWLTMARIVRGEVIALRQKEFVIAAQITGVSTPRIIWRHILPNIAGTIVVYATLTAPAIIILEAFLSFLGLGVQAPMSSWGLLIRYGVEEMEHSPWLLIAPGLVFSMTLLALNNLGDRLRDAFDVRR